MNFKEIFDKATDKTKLDFLFTILEHNEKLRTEFLNCIQKKLQETDNQISYEDFKNLINNSQKEYQDQLEVIDLEEPDWDNYIPPHSGYIEEWEAWQYMAEQEVDNVFNEWKDNLLDLIIEQKIEEGFAELIAIYKACLNSDVNDPYDNLGDPNEYFVDEHKKMIKYFTGRVSQSILHENTIQNSIKLFLQYCKDEYPGNENYPRYFEPVLLALAEKSGNPETILKQIENSEVKKKFLPQLVLLLNKLCGNSDDWLKSAETYYLADNKVAEQLLEYYLENDIDAFNRTANELLEKDKYRWAKFLADKISEASDRQLFKNVFSELTIKETKIEYYRKIKNILNEDEKEQLINTVYNKPFKVQIFEEEKQYDKIKRIVEKNTDSWDFTELIKPILEEYPDFCFETIKNKALKTIATQRGRTAYEKIAEWLKLAKLIPAHEDLTRELIMKLYYNKPNLPALKDEFRIAGLV